MTPALPDYPLPSAGNPGRRETTDHVIAQLVRHSVAEEQYLYPAARKVLPGGAD